MTNLYNFFIFFARIILIVTEKL